MFDEELLYFFYGRPAFRRDEDAQLRLSARAPIVIVMSPQLVDRGRRIFPFDTGAFESRYRDWVHRGMTLSDFELACPGDAPQRHVSAFFENNDHYLRLVASAPSVPYMGAFEVESIVQLLTDPSATNADDRRLAVELQIDREVPFEAPAVMALVVPDQLKQAPWLRAFAEVNADIEFLTFEWVPLRTAGHYQALLEERAVDLQVRKGWA